MLIQALCYEFYSRVQAFVYEIGGIFMSKSLYSVEQRLAFINDCYTSGLSVYAWCKEKQIAPGTFYSWIHYLKKQGCTLPEVVPINLREKPVREPREIVKVNIVEETKFIKPEANPLYVETKKNSCDSISSIRIQIADVTLDIPESVNPAFLSVSA